MGLLAVDGCICKQKRDQKGKKALRGLHLTSSFSGASGGAGRVGMGTSYSVRCLSQASTKLA